MVEKWNIFIGKHVWSSLFFSIPEAFVHRASNLFENTAISLATISGTLAKSEIVKSGNIARSSSVNSQSLDIFDSMAAHRAVQQNNKVSRLRENNFIL